MIDQVLFEYIRDSLTYTGTIKYGSAEGITPPYIVMTKITDPERPVTLCYTQGESGEALFQFSAYMGGSAGDASNGPETILYLDELKEQVKLIGGEITSSGMTYRVWGNITSGVTLLGTQVLETWGAMFETQIKWEYVETET